MFEGTQLRNYIENSPTVDASPLIVAEINMNSADRISKIGNYRYRPAESSSDYYVIASTYDKDDVDNNYTGATDSDALLDGGTDEDDNPIAFSSIQTNKKLYYSLEDCFGRFRPRSGINKAMWLGGQPGNFIGYDNADMMRRPRYYMASKDDKFKYWTSMRTENGIERGISNITGSISDAAPFVVYNEKIPTNRIVIKMQTNVGDVDLGPFKNSNLVGEIDDPFYDPENVINNRTVPTVWEVQYLNANNVWTTLYDSEDFDFIVPRDGYVELQYDNGSWEPNVANVSDSSAFMKNFTTPEQISGDLYKEFQYIYGLRIVVTQMSNPEAMFDLIELSPRLSIDLTNLTTDFRISKVASDLGVSGMPVGQLLASTGNITIADYDEAFNTANTDSVIANFIGKNIQIKFYEVVHETTLNYYVPLKTLYAESFPTFNVNDKTLTLDLRDAYTYFESMTAPQILIKNVSFSYAVAMLLDAVGFTNYVYKRVDNEDDPTIPFFFISPEKTVAEVLAELAISTQTAMFFDEENNLVLMSKNYILPGLGDRTNNVDMVLYGTKDFDNRTELSGYKDGTATMANIIDIASQDNTVFNGGTITYSARYIQKSYQNLKQANQVDRDKTWIYKPVLLWEVAGEETTKSINEDAGTQSSFTLSAIPLSSDLSADVPYVDANGVVQNNVIDLGDGVYWMGRYNGYFYSGSEIIRFDAVEYNIGAEQVVAQDVRGIAISGTDDILIESDHITSSIEVGQKIVQTGQYSKSLSETKISGTLSETNTLTLTNKSDTDMVFIGQELTTLSNQTNQFANVKFAYPNYVILDKDDEKATVENLYLNSILSSGDSEAYRTPGTYVLKLTKKEDYVMFSADGQYSDIYDNNNTGLTPKQLHAQVEAELASVKSDLRTIEVVTTNPVEANTWLDALPENPKLGKLIYLPKAKVFVAYLNAKARKTQTVTVRITKSPITLPANARIESFMSSKVKINGKEYDSNKVFTIDKTFDKTGTQSFEKNLIVGSTSGVIAEGATILAKTGEKTYTLSANNSSNGYVVFSGEDLAAGELTSSFASNPLRVESIDQSLSKRLTMSISPMSYGGVMFNVTNPSANVWISSVEEYQKFFAKIPFGGKLYPTGRVRIFSEPFIDDNGNRVPGAVSKHGRGQFGTTVQAHHAGLASHWSDDANVTGCIMESQEIFSQAQTDAIFVDTEVQSDTYSSTLGTTSAPAKIYVYSTENIEVGQLVSERYPGATLKIPEGTKVVSIPNGTDGTPAGYFTVDKVLTSRLQGDELVLSMSAGKKKKIKNTLEILSKKTITQIIQEVGTSAYPSAKIYAHKTTRNGIIKNFMANSYYSDSGTNKLYSTQTGTIQSSALVMQGRDFPDKTSIAPIDFISVVTKDLAEETGKMPTHVGTRLRIVGRIGNANDSQMAAGATTYFASDSINADTTVTVQGGSAGLGIMIDQDTVNGDLTSGYFYEIIALDNKNINSTLKDSGVVNVMFYKLVQPEVDVKIKSVKVTKSGSKYKATYILEDFSNRLGGKALLRRGINVAIKENGAGSSVPANLLFPSGQPIRTIGNQKHGERSVIVGLETLPSGVTLNTTYSFVNGVCSVVGLRKAIPLEMWSGLASILVDDGLFTGQYRMSGDENPSVYDLAVEYTEETSDSRKFYLYLNNKLIGSVVDSEPIAKKTKVGLFVRGSTRAMFEKIYAITPNREGDTVIPADEVLSGFNSFEKQLDSAFSNYKHPDQISKSYLESISPIKAPRNDMYLDEFGAIMREASYFNVKYDKAYPAFSATIAPTFNKLQGYAVAGFTAGSYNAEFLVFNITDSTITLDSETGNYLRILGVTFTQQSDHQLTVDQFFKENSDFSQTELSGSDLVLSKAQYQDIKSSRLSHGLKEFNINAPYIQSQDSANSLMKWITSKIMKPRKSVGVNIFPNPMIQLGDIVTIDYSINDVDQIIAKDARFVVYNIDYQRSSDGPSMTIYLSEVK